jgi:hypothetical protein
MVRRLFYRPLMRFLHRFNLHYAPPCYPDGDTMLWCHWCGFRQVVKRHPRTIADLELILDSKAKVPVTINPDGSITTDWPKGPRAEC